MQISGTREGDSMEKSEDRNKIISELQTVIKEQVELKEIEIPGTITFQVMSVDGGNVPVGAGEVLLLRYSATHLEYSHELEDENQKFHMAVHIIYCKEQKGLFGKVKYKTIKHRKEIITEADWKKYNRYHAVYTANKMINVFATIFNVAGYYSGKNWRR